MLKDIRKKLIQEAKEDWDRLINNGLNWSEARMKVERDYELLEIEIKELRMLILLEIERQQEMGIV